MVLEQQEAGEVGKEGTIYMGLGLYPLQGGLYILGTVSQK